MAYKIYLTPRSRADIAAAFAYLAERSPEAAGHWYNSITTDIASLSEMPGRCPAIHAAGVKCRQFIRGRYRVVFDIVEDAKAVRILTVRHSARREITDEEIQQIINDFEW
jgi:plasmid stabilization system protein ParE